jgi:pilus assembly protein Flp/PilA
MLAGFRGVTGMQLFRALLRSRRGTSAIEYALVASLIAVAALVAFQTLGGEIDNSFTRIDNAVSSAA